MKRFVLSSSLAVLLVAFVASPGLAQKLSAGVRGGISIANVRGDSIEGTSSKIGFVGGAFLGVDLHEYFRIQFEGQYVQKGAEEEEMGVTVKTKLDYIEFMVPFTLTIPMENSPIAPRLYAGPALGIEASCSLSGEEGGIEVDVDCDDPLLEDLIETKSTDFSVFFGGGVDIAVGSGAITLDVLYDLGLSSIDDTPGEDFDVKNKNLLRVRCLLAGSALLIQRRQAPNTEEVG